MLPEKVRRFFVQADLTQEGLDPSVYVQKWAGTTGYNNGILSVVDSEGTVWVSAVQVFKTCEPWDPEGTPLHLVEGFHSLYRDGKFLEDALQEAGYEAYGIYGMRVPHSNGSQDWVRAAMARAGVTRHGLLCEIENRRAEEATSARLQKIAAIATASETPSA